MLEFKKKNLYWFAEKALMFITEWDLEGSDS